MAVLIYVHDPMCSWCWGFSPVLDRLMSDLPNEVGVRRLLGGLAPDSAVPMPDTTRDYVQGQWRRVQQVIPGTEFNFDFWTRCAPRRSTYPACRAVIAARSQGRHFDPAMTRAIQRAYYLEARNPSDIATLVDLARETGLDPELFEHDLESSATRRQLDDEIAEARTLGVRGFPSLVMEVDGTHQAVAVRYRDHRPMIDEIMRYSR